MRRRTLLGGTAASLLAAPLSRPAVAQPARTATLRFVPQANLTSLDPIWTTATVTSNHGYYVYDTLYGADSGLRPKPQMAEGHQVSDDGRTWRIRLRDGLRFHDGTPVRAADCAASLQRWGRRDPFGQILMKVVDRWVTTDDRVLEMRLTRPFPLMLDALAKPDSNVPWIMPERIAVTDAMKAFTEVVGSGPYRFLPDEYNSGSHVAYAKFDGYVPRQEPPDWGAGGKVAHFPRVEWNIIPDPATAAAALRNNEADWWEQPLNDLLPALSRDPSIGTQIDNPQGRLALMRLNHLQAPFNDPAIRRAVLLAVNQEDYMRATIGDDTGLWSTCLSLYPCGTPYEMKDGSRLMKADPAAARAALVAAGYKGEKVVVLNPTDFPLIGPLGQVTADTLKKIGMNVDLQESDWGTVIQRRASREGTDKGGWSIFHTFGSAPNYATPATSPLVRGQGEAGWFGWWTSPRAESMVQDWLAAPDEAAQRRVAQAIGELAMEEVATVPLGRFFVRTAFRKTITGVLQGISPYPWNVRPA